MVSDDTTRARAVRYLHSQFAYLPANAEPVDDVAAFAGDARDRRHAVDVIRQMADRNQSPVAYKLGTGRTLVGLDLDSVDEALYWIRRYDKSELPSGIP